MLGLTGANAAGKGEVAAYLSERGFARHSLSDLVREEAAHRDLPPEREQLISIGNLLRREFGPGVLAERILPRLVSTRHIVDSIRNPAEVAVLRRAPRFRLIGIRAPLEVRFRRSLARARPGDPLTLAEFERREREENGSDPQAQQLEATFRLADYVLDNDCGLDALHRAVDGLLERLEAGG